jgi:uncharacterized protein YndB with AHSA1/START domain
MDAKSNQGSPDNSTSSLKFEARGDREIVMTRVFNAPRKLVFDALTKPELIKEWVLGPPGWTMPVCEIDLRVGGAYRFLWRHDDGKEMGSRGVYQEIVPLERIVATERFDDAWYPGEAITTNVLVEFGDKTTLTNTLAYESKEARDGVLKSGMQAGVTATYEQLAKLLAFMLEP